MVALITTLTCTLLFWVGLRIGRRLYASLGIEPAGRRNLAEDAGLAVAIGGATGMFVGTDITIVKNPIDTFVGVFPNNTPFEGCVKAGTSTALGFYLFHTIQNTRAQASSAYITKDAFRDIVKVVAQEYTNTPANSGSTKVSEWVDQEVENIFDKYDKDGDGKLTPEELRSGLADLQSSAKK